MIAKAVQRKRARPVFHLRFCSEAKGTCDRVRVVVIAGNLSIIINGGPDSGSDLDGNVSVNEKLACVISLAANRSSACGADYPLIEEYRGRSYVSPPSPRPRRAIFAPQAIREKNSIDSGYFLEGWSEQTTNAERCTGARFQVVLELNRFFLRSEGGKERDRPGPEFSPVR
jgi:hypothetical protein